MDDRRDEDRLYAVVVIAFLSGLVALGLLGVPALLVAAIGVLAAALGIAVFHRFFGAGEAPRAGRSRVPAKYVPSVLESGPRRRRRGVHLRRHRDPQSPLRLR